jgi:hypothetical protein
MKRDATEKELALLAKKAGQAVRIKTKSVKKALVAGLRQEMSHVRKDIKILINRKNAGKA